MPPSPVFLPRMSHGQRSLASYSPWGCRELDMTHSTHVHVHAYTHTYTIAFQGSKAPPLCQSPPPTQSSPKRSPVWRSKTYRGQGRIRAWSGDKTQVGKLGLFTTRSSCAPGRGRWMRKESESTVNSSVDPRKPCQYHAWSGCIWAAFWRPVSTSTWDLREEAHWRRGSRVTHSQDSTHLSGACCVQGDCTRGWGDEPAQGRPGGNWAARAISIPAASLLPLFHPACQPHLP